MACVPTLYLHAPCANKTYIDTYVRIVFNAQIYTLSARVSIQMCMYVIFVCRFRRTTEVKVQTHAGRATPADARRVLPNTAAVFLRRRRRRGAGARRTVVGSSRFSTRVRFLQMCLTRRANWFSNWSAAVLGTLSSFFFSHYFVSRVQLALRAVRSTMKTRREYTS